MADIANCPLLTNAAFSENLELIKYLCEKRYHFPDDEYEDVLGSCTDHGNIEIVRYFIEFWGIDPNIKGDYLHTLDTAVEKGNLEMIKYLYKTGKCNLKEAGASLVVAANSVEMIKYLVEVCKIDPNIDFVGLSSL